MARISIIIPVYNTAEYLEECIKSAVSQTMEDIEIICVDDCSTDRSREILEGYARQDKRLRLICFDEHRGTSQARKDGVLSSGGEYIMFMDSDDTLSENACEEAYKAICEAGTDIVHFGTEIINCGGVNEERIKRNQNIVKPYTKSVIRGDIVRPCFEERLFRFQLWNKIYKGDICRSAFSEVEDGSFPKAQDLYAFFLIALHSDSYAGIDTVLYHYHFGRSVAGRNLYDTQYFERLLSGHLVVEALDRYIQSHALTEYADLTGTIASALKIECMDGLISNLQKHLIPQGVRNYIDVWGYDALICSAAALKWNRPDTVMDMLDNASCVLQSEQHDEVRCIGIYYRNIIQGGAQKITAELCRMWSEIKNEAREPRYQVVLITDSQQDGIPDEEITDLRRPADPSQEYPIPDSVIREYLPVRRLSIDKNFYRRYDAWKDILDRRHIDVIVNGLWLDSSFYWDYMAVKGHRSAPAVVMHCHLFMGVPFLYKNSAAHTVACLMKRCDGVVTLTGTDREYAKYFSDYAKAISNPLSFRTDEVAPSSCDGKQVVWAGRIDPVKRPMDALMVIDEVRKTIPDVKLIMAGDGSEDIKNEMADYIREKHLERNVVYEGFVTDMKSLYQQSSVFLSTSTYEGFFLAQIEAMGCGLPSVSYDLPYLPQFEDRRGLMVVPQGDIRGAASALADLLQNPEKRKTLGRDARAFVEDLEKEDIVDEWKDFFDHLFEDHPNPDKGTRMHVLLDQIVRSQQEGRDGINQDRQAEIQKMKQERSVLQEEKRERGEKIRDLERDNRRLTRERQERGVEVYSLRCKKEENERKISEQEKLITQQQAELDYLHKNYMMRPDVAARKGAVKIVHKAEQALSEK